MRDHGMEISADFLTPKPLSEAEQFLANAGLQDTGPCCELSAWHTANCPPFEEMTVQAAPVEEP